MSTPAINKLDVTVLAGVAPGTMAAACTVMGGAAQFAEVVLAVRQMR